MCFHVPEFSLEVRKVTAADLPAVLEVYRGCEDFLALGPIPTASMEMVLKDIDLSRQAGGQFCGIFTPSGKMIGVLDYVPDNYQGNPPTACLSLLMITASWRNRGVGQAMVAAFERWIRKNPRVTTILSGVQVNNPGAIRFWQRMGYRITSGPILHADQTTAFDLRKDLEPEPGREGKPQEGAPSMTTIGKPGISTRPAQAYMGIRTLAPFKGMSRVIDKINRELTAWVKANQVETVGPPFLRYHVIDMRGTMDITFAVPVAQGLPGNGVVTPGELPAGRYAHLVYSGGGISGNRALIEWVRAQGLEFDRWDSEQGDNFCGRYETFLTDPVVEPRKSKWQIEVAIKLAGD